MNVRSCSGRDIRKSYISPLYNHFANALGTAHADHMIEPQAHRYTHGHHESVLRSHTWRTAENSAAYLLPWLRPGLDLLDVGCGPGTITVDLARQVAPGQVVGLDIAEE